MENSWLNPMCHEKIEFVSLSTGTVAPADFAKDLLGSHQVGEVAYQVFKKKRLEKAPPTMKFHDKMTKQKTFFNVNAKKASGRGTAKEVVLKAEIHLFGHMILVAQSRQLHVRDVLAHPLAPLPWDLANGDGSLRKTNKAGLARELERNISPSEDIPDPSTCIIDGMSLVQKMNSNNKHNWQNLSCL